MSASSIPLSSIARALSGILPGSIATSDAEGTPNISFLSDVRIVDARHVALSRQFFNKTSQNLEQNPHACVEVHDPITLQPYRLRLRFVRSEREGPLFAQMSSRIEAIASHIGLKGVFKLLSADVFEVLEVEALEGFLGAPVEVPGPPLDPRAPIGELVALQTISARINRAGDLDALLGGVLAALEELLGFAHSMVLVPESGGETLVTIASRGYGEGGIGAEVAIGEGLIGTAADERRAIAIGGIDAGLRYGRAIRDRAQQVERRAARPEIPLPGLPDARAQMAMPLTIEDRLIGVLAIESRDAAALELWHESFVQVIANQLASRMDRLAETEREREASAEDAEEDGCVARVRISMPSSSRTRTFCFYASDDCVFVDGEYLIRNVPGKILWKLLTTHARERRSEYSNRELRLDPWLGLPAVKDNLESRLILLRKRLEEKCPDVRIVPTRRGRFALELGCAVELTERDGA